MRISCGIVQKSDSAKTLQSEKGAEVWKDKLEFRGSGSCVGTVLWLLPFDWYYAQGQVPQQFLLLFRVLFKKLM